MTVLELYMPTRQKYQESKTEQCEVAKLSAIVYAMLPLKRGFM
jgi:hypothetical protein